MQDIKFTIRKARPEEFREIGRLLHGAYSRLPGMPGPTEQPEYFEMLLDVSKRAAIPSLEVLIAVSDQGLLAGSVDYIGDLGHYGTGKLKSLFKDGAGIRLLGVGSEFSGNGIGKALTLHCLQRARETSKSHMLLHTTRVMEKAWGMYERIGFARFPEADLKQGKLEVFGFAIKL